MIPVYQVLEIKDGQCRRRGYMRKLSYTAFAIFVHSSSFASAQQPGDVPDNVVDACMAQKDASGLPECLKEGAYGQHMLQLALTKDLYGDSAQPIINSCKALNQTMQGAWTCFSVAAEKAVETRTLIGLDKITDECVAAISDPALLTRLENQATEQRDIWFPEEMFSGGNIYHTFKGCES